MMWTKETNDHNVFYHSYKKKTADTVTAPLSGRSHSSHISIAFTTNFNFL